MTHRGRIKRAFSLIEVVISIVVLSLGLLGVLAAFPSVIVLQQRAQDDVLGSAALGAAEAAIRASIFESDQLVDTNDDDVYYTPRELVFLDSGLSSNDAISLDFREMGYLWEWEQLWPGRDGRDRTPSGPGEAGPIHSGNPESSNLLNGIITIGGGKDTVPQGGVYIDPGNTFIRVENPTTDASPVAGGPGVLNTVTPGNDRDLDRYEIPVATRLFPQPGSGAEPRYVWDFVLRRVDAGFEEDDSGDAVVSAGNIPFLPVQAVVFVRRIDAGIRLPRQIANDSNFTLAEALTGVVFETGNPVPDGSRRLPVSARVQPGGLSRIGVTWPTIPTNDGSMPTRDVGYSPILGIEITVNRNNAGLDVIDFRNPGTNRQALAPFRAEAGKPLQILVDNNGGVRRVLEVLDTDNQGVPTRVRVEPAFSPSESQVEQAVFTPQVPVAVRVLEFRP